MPKIIKNGISYGVTANLSDLYDTNITNPANGDILQYTVTTGQWENIALSGAFLPTTGGTMTGQIKFSDNSAANIVVPARSMSYINKNGNAGIYAKKTINSAQWYPVVCQDTKSGGHWQIGNYNSENLEFVYGTKTNRDNDTNNTQRFSLVPWNDNNNHDAEIITSKNIGSQSVASATSATSATTATGAGQLNSRGTASGTNHATALQAFFNANKASIPRNVGINIYSSAYSNGSTCFGYFLNGYDTAPYGGFFVAHYNTPKYVGIQGGSYSEQNIITSSTIGSQTVSKAGTCTGNAATATTATKGNTVANWSGGGTSGTLRFHAQTSVLTVSGGADAVGVVSAASLNTIFGVSNCGAGNTAVFVSNGDAGAFAGHYTGASYVNNTWIATFDRGVTGAVRVNWLAVYWA